MLLSRLPNVLGRAWWAQMCSSSLSALQQMPHSVRMVTSTATWLCMQGHRSCLNLHPFCAPCVVSVFLPPCLLPVFTPSSPSRLVAVAHRMPSHVWIISMCFFFSRSPRNKAINLSESNEEKWLQVSKDWHVTATQGAKLTFHHVCLPQACIRKHKMQRPHNHHLARTPGW